MRKSLLAFLLLSLLTACQSPPGSLSSSTDDAIDSNPWSGALRALDPADTATPAYDLTAVYLLQVEDGLQIRVDLLDFQNANDLALDVKIGDSSSPEETRLAIHIPSEDGQTRISLDPLLATVTIDISLSDVPSHPRVDVSTPQDKISGLALDGPVPTQAAPLLLTFYDTFAGRFPAEALRRWDGAHTGPRGERHGLKHLLDAVEEYQTPVVLLDLKEPDNLSVLDAMGVLPHIRQMEKDGLLLLPDQAEPQTLFGFTPSPFSWGGLVAEQPRKGATRLTFTSYSDPNHLYRPHFRKTTFIPTATETETTQPTPDGPSLEVRRALLETALNADGEDLLVLGGSLQETTWGSPDLAGATLAYFASRPYVHVLTADDLMSFPSRPAKPELISTPVDESFDKLETHYRNLTQPVLDFVANWKGSPLSSCATDLDKDNQPECVLANENYLAIFDPMGARLTYLFAVERDSIPLYPQQLIGPSWQVAFGLSNPSTWDLVAGEAADPGAYPGAFADADGPFAPYQPNITGHTLVFTSKGGTRTKAFSLTNTSIEVEYQTQEPVATQIPLLVDPETRFTPGWAGKYALEKTPSGVAWGLVDGPMVRITADGAVLSLSKDPVTMRAFNESLAFLSGPEDPDFDYPPGHYVPFPMAIAEVEMQDGYFLRLERLP